MEGKFLIKKNFREYVGWASHKIKNILSVGNIRNMTGTYPDKCENKSKLSVGNCGKTFGSFAGKFLKHRKEGRWFVRLFH